MHHDWVDWEATHGHWFGKDIVHLPLFSFVACLESFQFDHFLLHRHSSIDAERGSMDCPYRIWQRLEGYSWV